MSEAYIKKVLHIAASNTGGAGMVPGMLHREFAQRGHFSRILVHGKDSQPNEHVIAYNSPFRVFLHRISAAIKRRITRRRPQSRYDFINRNESNHYLPPQRILKKIGFVPDVIIIYWINGFINTPAIRDLYAATGAQMIWVTTDMAPYTGGCHYAWTCKGYETDCGQCPAWEGKREKNLLARRNLAIKKQALADVPITVVASHGQSLEMATASALFRDHILQPHYLPVDTTAFEGISQREARQKLGVPDDKICLFFGAIRLEDERKGWPMLREALQLLARSMTQAQRENLILLIAGQREAHTDMETGWETLFVGSLDFHAALPLAFIAADGYLSSSIQDTGPYMVNLSVAHGCPVVAFDVGVSRALVRNGQTGFCAEEMSAQGFCTAIHRLIALPPAARDQMRQDCRKVGQKELRWTDMLSHLGLDSVAATRAHS